MKQYFTVSSLAKALGLSIHTVYGHVKKKHLAAKTAGKRAIRIERKDAEAWAALYFPAKTLNLEGVA